jgi:hypothetical protein
MLKTILTNSVLPIALLFGPPPTAWSNSAKNPDSRAPTGALQKMIVENGSVTMDFDLNRLNGTKDLKNLLCFRAERVRKIIFSKCFGFTKRNQRNPPQCQS